MTGPAASLPPGRLGELRQSSGLGVRELARVAGLSASFLSELESGAKRNISQQHALRLANALGVSIQGLLAPADCADPAMEAALSAIVAARHQATKALREATLLALSRRGRGDLSGPFRYLPGPTVVVEDMATGTVLRVDDAGFAAIVDAAQLPIA